MFDFLKWGRAALAIAFALSVTAARADGPVFESTSPGSVAAQDTDIVNNDVSGFQTVDVQFSSVGSGNTVTFAGSNDGTNWVTTPGITTAGGVTTGVVAVATGVHYVFPLTMKYWRYRVTTYGSGTVTSRTTYKSMPTPSIAALGGTTVVGGPAADDAAASGNPVPVGGIYNTTLPTYSNLDRTQLQTGSRGSINVSIFSPDSTSGVASDSINGDGVSVSGTGLLSSARTRIYNPTANAWDRERTVANATDSTGTGIAAAGILAQGDDTSPTAITENQFGNLRLDKTNHSLLTGQYNGSTAEVRYGNADITVLASAARTASVNSADLTNYNGRGVHVVIDATAETGTADVTCTIQGKDALSGQYYTILAAAVISGIETRVLRVFPAATAAANTIANDIMPRTWRVSCSAADADSLTYSIGASVIL